MASLLKNTAGQFFTFCLVSSTSTAGFPASTSTNTSTTGSPASRVVLRVYGDAKTQNLVAGTLKSLGSGQWSYAPTQAETNNNKFGFFFAVPNCVPVNISLQTDIGVPTVDGSAQVTVGTNNDKTGYSLTQAFPSNFSSLSISTLGRLTVGTNNDKTGYSLTQAFPAHFSTWSISAGGAVSIAQSFPSNFSSLAISGAGALTVGTMNDKTGYSITQAFPTHFSVWAIDGSGQVTVGTMGTKTGYSLSQAFPSNFANMRISGTSGRIPITSNTQQGIQQTGPLTFVMTQGSMPTTGLKVVGQRVSNGLPPLVTITNSTGITEIGKGLYSVTLSSNDMNSQGFMLRFTSTTTATSSTTKPVDDRPIWINPLP